MTSSLKCPTEETIAALVEGVLLPEEGEALLVHMDHCQRCFELYAECLSMVDAEKEFSNVPIQLFPDKSPKQSILKSTGLLIAASLLIFLGTNLFRTKPGFEDEFQKALHEIGEADGWRIKRFHYPMRLSKETVKDLRITRGETRWSPLQSENIESALVHLEHRVQNHPGDRKAAIAFITLSFSSGRLELARNAAMNLLETFPNDAEIQMLALLCEYESKPDATKNYAQQMKTLSDQHPQNASLAFNAARLMEENNLNGDPKPYWDRYLENAGDDPRIIWLED